MGHTLTQQPNGCTSLVAGYVLMIDLSGLWKEADVNDFFYFFKKGIA